MDSQSYADSSDIDFSEISISDMEALKNENNRLKQNLVEIFRQLNQSQNECKKYKDKLNELEEVIAHTIIKVGESDPRAKERLMSLLRSDSSKSFSTLLTEGFYAQLKKEELINNLENGRNVLIEKIDSYKSQISDLKKQLEKANENNANLSTQYASLVGLFDNATKEIEEQKKKIAGLTREATKNFFDARRIKTQLEKSQFYTDELKQMKVNREDDYKSEIQKLRNSIKVMKKQNKLLLDSKCSDKRHDVLINLIKKLQNMVDERDRQIELYRYLEDEQKVVGDIELNHISGTPFSLPRLSRKINISNCTGRSPHMTSLGGGQTCSCCCCSGCCSIMTYPGSSLVQKPTCLSLISNDKMSRAYDNPSLGGVERSFVPNYKIMLAENFGTPIESYKHSDKLNPISKCLSNENKSLNDKNSTFETKFSIGQCSRDKSSNYSKGTSGPHNVGEFECKPDRQSGTISKSFDIIEKDEEESCSEIERKLRSENEALKEKLLKLQEENFSLKYNTQEIISIEGSSVSGA